MVHFETEGCTVVLVEHGQQLLGAIAVRDEVRPEAATVVASLRRLGITTVAMLTGDNARTATSLGRTAGIDQVHAGLLPEQKVGFIDDLRRTGHTAMVGDGINDAPAIETADVALLGEDLSRLHAGFFMLLSLSA